MLKLLRWVIACSLILGVLATACRSQTVPDTKRVIFNSDGYEIFKAGSDDITDVSKYVFTGLEGSNVTTLFWCDGAGGNTANYDSQVLELTGTRIGDVPPQLLKWIDEGNDPPAFVIKEARKRDLEIFYSFRINDIHDHFKPELLATFKIDHPDWLIDSTEYGYPTALNFAVPEVRELKLSVIREICSKYDFDGIEIDFMRGPPFFTPSEEQANKDILTDFLRTTREMLTQLGEDRGREIEMAVRVGENLGACTLDGFDIETWVQKDLTDMIILGSGAIDIDITAFKKITGGTSIQVYPCLYGWPSGYMPISEEMARGLAYNYWQQHADGIYLFNWFPHSSPYQIQLLKEIGSMESLENKDKMFAADRAPDPPIVEYPHNWLLAPLPRVFTGFFNGSSSWESVPIQVFDDLASRENQLKAITLSVEISHSVEPGSIECRFNGHAVSLTPLPDATKATTNLLEADWFVVGENTVELRLKNTDTENDTDITIRSVEIYVEYD